MIKEHENKYFPKKPIPIPTPLTKEPRWKIYNLVTGKIGKTSPRI